MKTRLTIFVGLVAVGVGLTYWQVDLVSSAVAGDGSVVAAAATVLPTLGGEGETKYEYVGNKKCRKCHSKEYKSWNETAKAKTFEPLKPGQASEAKQKHNLDPAKDYTKDEGCLACHSTGYGKPGGYFVPDAADEEAVKKAEKLLESGDEATVKFALKYLPILFDYAVAMAQLLEGDTVIVKTENPLARRARVDR